MTGNKKLKYVVVLMASELWLITNRNVFTHEEVMARGIKRGCLGWLEEDIKIKIDKFHKAIKKQKIKKPLIKLVSK